MFVELSRGERGCSSNGFRFWRVKAMAVEFQEDASGRERNTLVAVNEGMVLSDRVSVRSGKLKGVGLLVLEVVLRTRQGCVERPFIEKPRRTAVVSQ